MALADLEKNFLFPVRGCAVYQPLQRIAAHCGWRFQCASGHDGGRQINEAHQFIHHTAAGEAGAMYDHRDANTAIMTGAFIFAIAGAEV